MSVLKLLTVKEVSTTLRMSRNGVLNLIARGQLPAVRVPGARPERPGRVLVDEEDLCEYINRWKNGECSRNLQG